MTQLRIYHAVCHAAQVVKLLCKYRQEVVWEILASVATQGMRMARLVPLRADWAGG